MIVAAPCTSMNPASTPPKVIRKHNYPPRKFIYSLKSKLQKIVSTARNRLACSLKHSMSKWPHELCLIGIPRTTPIYIFSYKYMPIGLCHIQSELLLFPNLLTVPRRQRFPKSDISMKEKG
jgi:hypothetical protein